MKKIFTGILITLLTLLMIDNFVNLSDDNSYNSIQLDYRDFHEGKIFGWGRVEDFLGRETNTFLIEVDGTWDDKDGFLEERYNFLNGYRLNRTIALRQQDQNTFIFNSGDISNPEFLKVINNGYDLNFNYRPEGSEMYFDVQKKFRISSSGTANVEITFRKFGIKVSRIEMALIKSDFIPILNDFDTMNIYDNSISEYSSSETEQAQLNEADGEEKEPYGKGGKTEPKLTDESEAEEEKTSEDGAKENEATEPKYESRIESRAELESED